jgi:outer membrane protein assembly factor BamB
MTQNVRHGWLLLAVPALLAIGGAAFAIIEAPLPLAAILIDSDFIAVGKVEKIDGEIPQVIVTVQEDLKGKAPVRRLAIHFKGDDDAKKFGHVPQLLKRLAPELPVILFASKRDKNYTSFAYTNGTWFRIAGQKSGDDVAWRLMHGEPFLRRTFKGTTAELKQLVIDDLAGKGKLPKYNKKEKPGFGPEIETKDKEKSSRHDQPPAVGSAGGPLFGVIPTLGVGAPLLVLAALFPAVFGGVLLLFRQWIAFISVFSMNSTLMLLQWLLNAYWPSLLRDSWLGGEPGLWFVMTLVALLGTVWAWQRQVARLSPAASPMDVPPATSFTVQAPNFGTDDPEPEAPRKTELTVLWSLSATFLLASVLTPLLSWWFTKHYDPRSDLACVSMVVLTFGVLAGTLYRVGRDRIGVRAPLATEGVMVAAILLGQVGYLGYRWGGEDLGNSAAPVAIAEPSGAIAGLNAPTPAKIRWKFVPPNFSGVILSGPLLHGDDVWVGAARTSFAQGTLYCVDRTTGEKKWEFFGDDGNLKQMISSPVIAEGRLYIGEGFHNDPSCRLFCVDFKERKQLWAFPTGSQTEATPCVRDGKVYFGAGNDGIYCVDAIQGGTPFWRFPPADSKGRLLRCGSSPAVVGNRLYAGSAIDRNQKDDRGETAIFCLDAGTGTQHWKTAVPLPSWAGPVVSEGHVFYALGNGDMLSDASELEPPETPAGMMLSVDALTGKEIWRFEVPNGVLDKPAVDAHSVYFGCRDGHVYCLRRSDGKPRWKAKLDAPVIASPVVAHCPGYDQTAHVFALSTAGKLVCLNPATGDAHWTLPLTDKSAHFSATPSVAVTRTDAGDRREIYVAGSLGDVPGRPVLYRIEDFVKVQ